MEYADIPDASEESVPAGVSGFFQGRVDGSTAKPWVPWTMMDLELRVIDDRRFHVLDGFTFVWLKPDSSREFIEVPGSDAHDDERCASCTDLASIPAVLRGLLSPYGRHLPAALAHDRLCELYKDEKVAGRGRVARDRADDVFLAAMQDKVNPVNRFQARALWAGVSSARFAKERRMQLLAILVLLVVAWASAVVGLNAAHRIWSFQPGAWWRWGWFAAFVASVFGADQILSRIKQRHSDRPPSLARWVIALALLPALVTGFLSAYALFPLRWGWPEARWWDSWFDGPWPSMLVPLGLAVASIVLAVSTTRRRSAEGRWNDRLFPVTIFALGPFVVPILLPTFVAQTVMRLSENIYSDRSLYRTGRAVDRNPAPTPDPTSSSQPNAPL